MKIALFDIDGTLVWSHGAGRRAMKRALTEATGGAGPSDHRYDGKTDRQIVREALRHDGLAESEIDACMEAVIERYVAELTVELDRHDHGAVALPGVPELLHAIEARGDMLLGLLTGNVVAGAEWKLRAVGIDPGRFKIGAFGSDHETRNELAAIACSRASLHLGVSVPGHACVVIGDTPSDVACARPIGARAIAVATGSFDIDALRACEPEAVFADFRDTDAVLHAIVHA